MGKKEKANRDNEVSVKFLVILSTAMITLLGFAIANIENLTDKQIIFGIIGALCLAILLGVVAKVYWETRKKL